MAWWRNPTDLRPLCFADFADFVGFAAEHLAGLWPVPAFAAIAAAAVGSTLAGRWQCQR